MALGRHKGRQSELLVTWAEMPRSPGHAFYDRLQAELHSAGFDGFVESQCAPYYAARQGRPFKTFGEVMAYIVEHEGPLALFKGIGPQITKGLLVQGFLMMTKERVELLFVLLFRYFRKVRAEKLQKVAELAAAQAAKAAPVLMK